MKTTIVPSINRRIVKPDIKPPPVPLNLMQSDLKGMPAGYSAHRPIMPSPQPLQEGYYPDNHIVFVDPNVPTSTPGVNSQTSLAAAAAAAAIGNSRTASFMVRKQQAMQEQYNNAMSAEAGKAAQQQHLQQAPIMPHQQIMQANPQMNRQQIVFQTPVGVAYKQQMAPKQQPQQSTNGQSQQPMQFQIYQPPQSQQQPVQQQQQQQLQQPQPHVQQQQPLQSQPPQRAQKAPLTQQEQVQRFQLQQLQQYQAQQYRQHHLQQAQQQMPAPSIQAARNPVMMHNGLKVVKSSSMINQLGATRPHQTHKTNSMPGNMASPSINGIPTSAPSSSLAAAAAAAALSQRRNSSQTATRMRRSFSSSSQNQPLPPKVSQQWAQPQQMPYSNSSTPTSMHFGSGADLSAGMFSPNSPTFPISQYPSPSTTGSEIDPGDDGSNLMSPIVSPFLPNMPPIWFHTDAKRPGMEYSVDEVMANAECHDSGSNNGSMTSEISKRRRSNAHIHVDINRRLSSPGELSNVPATSFEFHSPSSSGSPAGPTGSGFVSPAMGPVTCRKPPTPTLSATTLQMTPRLPGKHGSSPMSKSPRNGSFSPTDSTSSSREKTPVPATAAFASQGQQLVFPLMQMGDHTIETKEISPDPRYTDQANGMGRFDVLKFHMYEAPDDRRKSKPELSNSASVEDLKDEQPNKIAPTFGHMPNSTDTSKRISMVKEEEDEEDIKKSSIDGAMLNTSTKTLSSDTPIEDIKEQPQIISNFGMFMDSNQTFESHSQAVHLNSGFQDLMMDTPGFSDDFLGGLISFTDNELYTNPNSAAN